MQHISKPNVHVRLSIKDLGKIANKIVKVDRFRERYYTRLCHLPYETVDIAIEFDVGNMISLTPVYLKEYSTSRNSCSLLQKAHQVI